MAGVSPALPNCWPLKANLFSPAGSDLDLRMHVVPHVQGVVVILALARRRT
jgi:hypothetical protein